MLDTLTSSVKFILKADKKGNTSIKGILKSECFTEVEDITLPYTIESR